jgi:hypothetical protein
LDWLTDRNLTNWLIERYLSDWVTAWLASIDLVYRLTKLNRCSGNLNSAPKTTLWKGSRGAGQNNRISLFELAMINNERLLSSHSTTIDAAVLGRQV